MINDVQVPEVVRVPRQIPRPNVDDRGSPRDGFGANPLSETDARLKASRVDARARGDSVARADELPRNHVVPDAPPPPAQDEGVLARLFAFFGRRDKQVTAVLLGAAAVPALGMPAGAAVVDAASPAIGAELAALERNARFQALTEDTRAIVRTEVARHGDSLTARWILGQLVDTAGFGQLAPAEQQLLFRYVGGANEQVSTGARFSLGNILRSDEFKNLDAAGQAERLRRFVTTNEGASSVVYTSREAPTRAAYVLGAPTDAPAYRFRSGTADAKRYELEIDGRRVVLIAPATTDAAQGHFHTPEQVAMAFAGLPELSRSLTRELVIEPGRNPEDAYWAEQFGDPDMRAYMTAGEGRISVYPTVHGSSQAQLDGSMIHETGHLLADTRFGHDRDSDAWKAWIAAGTRDGIAPSKYATRSPGEDISETLQLWVQVRGTPHEAEIRALFPNRIALLERLLNQP